MSKPLPQHRLFITLSYFRYCYFYATFENLSLYMYITQIFTTQLVSTCLILASFSGLSFGTRKNAKIDPWGGAAVNFSTVLKTANHLSNFKCRM